MLEKLKHIVLYGGQDRESYQQYEKYIREQDMKRLPYYLLMTGFFFLILGVANQFLHIFTAENTVLYLVSSGLSFLDYLLQRLITRRSGPSSRWQTVCVMVFMGILYMFSIVLAMVHTDLPSVTYIGVLILLPLVFALRPVFTICVQAVATVAFCISVALCKTPEIVPLDIWNGISFFVVSIFTILIITPIRINNLIQNEMIRRLSEMDQLTGLRNRNSYELDFPNLSRQERRPVCIYVDANGLHELNNHSGHAAGDTMLRTLASRLHEAFGDQYSYRIGGDEFISFTFGSDAEDVRATVRTMCEELSRMGYQFSFGVAGAEVADESVEMIVKHAESNMYEAKDAYYNKTGLDRRKR